MFKKQNLKIKRCKNKLVYIFNTQYYRSIKVPSRTSHCHGEEHEDAPGGRATGPVHQRFAAVPPCPGEGREGRV